MVVEPQGKKLVTVKNSEVMKYQIFRAENLGLPVADVSETLFDYEF